VVGFTPRPFYPSSHFIEVGCDGHSACTEDVANSSYPRRESKPGSHYLIEVSLHSFRNGFLCVRENCSPDFKESRARNWVVTWCLESEKHSVSKNYCHSSHT